MCVVVLSATCIVYVGIVICVMLAFQRCPQAASVIKSLLKKSHFRALKIPFFSAARADDLKNRFPFRHMGHGALWRAWRCAQPQRSMLAIAILYVI